MKPCFRNRKLLALLALGNLEAERATALRDHVTTCEGCRCYLDELANVTATLGAVEMKADIIATESFHRRVVAVIKADEPRDVRPSIREFFRGTLLNWRVAVSTVGGIAVVLLIGLSLTSAHRSDVPLPPSSSAHSGSEHSLDADFRPTIANYQMVANQSLEKLDQLLTEQGSRNLPSAPIYTASSFVSTDVSN